MIAANKALYSLILGLSSTIPFEFSPTFLYDLVRVPIEQKIEKIYRNYPLLSASESTVRFAGTDLRSCAYSGRDTPVFSIRYSYELEGDQSVLNEKLEFESCGSVLGHVAFLTKGDGLQVPDREKIMGFLQGKIPFAMPPNVRRKQLFLRLLSEEVSIEFRRNAADTTLARFVRGGDSITFSDHFQTKQKRLIRQVSSPQIDLPLSVVVSAIPQSFEPSVQFFVGTKERRTGWREFRSYLEEDYEEFIQDLLVHPTERLLDSFPPGN
jgi:hypothetical protein